MRGLPIKVEVGQYSYGNIPVIDLSDGTERRIEGYQVSLEGNVLRVRGVMSELIYPTIRQIRKNNDYVGGYEIVGREYQVAHHRINCDELGGESLVIFDLDHVCSDPNFPGIQDSFKSGITRIHLSTKLCDHTGIILEIYHTPARRFS